MKVTCAGCGAEIDTETGAATFDGEPVEGNDGPATQARIDELERENGELKDELAKARGGEPGADDDENPFFKRT